MSDQEGNGTGLSSEPVRNDFDHSVDRICDLLECFVGALGRVADALEMTNIQKYGSKAVEMARKGGKENSH